MKLNNIMKDIFILVTFMFVAFTFLSVNAQPQQLTSVSERFSQFSYTEDDSLLFDGKYGNSNYFNKVREECNLKVTKVQGKAFGTILTIEIENLCGVIDTVPKLTYGQLKVGDIVISEGILRTQDFSQLEVELKDGKNVWLAPTTEFKMGKDYCKGNGYADLYSGEVHVSGGKGDGNTYINAGHSTVHITKTEFSVEIVKADDITTDILKVYEGSVSFSLNMQNKEIFKSSEDKGAELKKLTEDYQSGKISLEEFTKKFPVLEKELTETLPKSATVNAGFQSKIVGTENPTEPESFDVNENRWWEN